MAEIFVPITRPGKLAMTIPMGFGRRRFQLMADFKPTKVAYNNEMTNDLGWLISEFECFEPNPQFTWNKQKRKEPSKDAWKIVVPRTAPPVGELPKLISKLIEATWKFAEPSRDVTRGPISIG